MGLGHNEMDRPMQQTFTYLPGFFPKQQMCTKASNLFSTQTLSICAITHMTSQEKFQGHIKLLGWPLMITQINGSWVCESFCTWLQIFSWSGKWGTLLIGVRDSSYFLHCLRGLIYLQVYLLQLHLQTSSLKKKPIFRGFLQANKVKKPCK